MFSGDTKVVTAGRDGLLKTSWAAVYVDGKLVGKTRVGSARPQAHRTVQKVGRQGSPRWPRRRGRARTPSPGVGAGDRPLDAQGLRLEHRPVQLPGLDVEP